jgi:glycosyltransferase involved in cell wall biosynthesis
VYERRDASQEWGLGERDARVLAGASQKAGVLGQVLARRYRAVFLEAWGTALLAAVGLTALAAGVPLVVSGDTWRGGGSGLVSLRRFLRQLLLRRAAATLPGGSRQRAFFVKEGARPDRVVVRQMTVDVESLQRLASELAPARDEIRVSFGVRPGVVVALVVARLVPEKGIDLLLQAVGQVPGLHALVVGDGPNRDELELLGNDLGIAHRVTWTGRLNQGDVVRAYVAADLFVLPSRFEPWGLVVNEAMACGLPVVVSSAAGCVDDLVAGKGSGTVVPAGDARSFAHALAGLAGDAALRARAATRARELIARWTLTDETSAIRRALDLAVSR